MDYLRRGYKTHMRTIQGEPAVPVVWYRVTDPNAKLYEGWHSFGSNNYYADHEWDGIGEQEGYSDRCTPRCLPWYNGQAPALYDGQAPCGSPEVAERGGIRGVDPVWITDERGRPPCCGGEGVYAPLSIGVGFAGQVVPSISGGELPLGLAFAGQQLPSISGGELPLGLAFVVGQAPATSGGEIPLGLAFVAQRPPHISGGEIPLGLAFVGRLVDRDGSSYPLPDCRPITGCADCPEAPQEITFTVLGMTGNLSVLNGFVVMPSAGEGACAWRTEGWEITSGVLPRYQLQARWTSLAQPILWNPDPSFSCCGTTTYRLVEEMPGNVTEEEWASVPREIVVASHCCDDGVSTSCCPGFVARRLVLTISGPVDASCVLTWDPDFFGGGGGAWVGELTSCGGVSRVDYRCQGETWALNIGQVVNGQGLSFLTGGIPAQCVPYLATGPLSGTTCDGVSTDGATWTVTE